MASYLNRRRERIRTQTPPLPSSVTRCEALSSNSRRYRPKNWSNSGTLNFARWVISFCEEIGSSGDCIHRRGHWGGGIHDDVVDIEPLSRGDMRRIPGA